MYEYLLENLISYRQVDGNLRRAAKKGLVSELYRKQMNALALKYFGVDSNGNYTENKEDIVAYRCPYSGEIINDLSTAWLEHILPISSDGGTVLFNCIPILKEVNSSKNDEPNLLVWWQGKGKEYFSYDRLERLIQYMLEAYTLAFKEPIEEELYDYDNSLNNDDYIENDDLSIDLKDRISIKTNTNIQQNITYYQLINDLINELSKNRDVSKYSSQLNNIKEQNVFGNINEIEKVINVVQTVFKEVLGDNSKKYLSYSLKIDMNKLLNSLKTNDYENEIRERINNIKSILMKDGKNINDYFESITDIEEENILYKNNLSQDDITYFLETIRLSHKSKIRIFIDMLSDSKFTNYINGLPDNNNIFSVNNKIHFKNYEHIHGLHVLQFWKNNSEEIVSEIMRLRQELLANNAKTTDERLVKLNSALKAIDDYNFANQYFPQKRIEVFIEMLSNSKYTNYVNGTFDENNIFARDNKIPFEGYEHIQGLNTSHFWTHNSDRIIQTIKTLKNNLESKEEKTYEEEQKLIKLNMALKAIDNYNFANKSNSQRRIEVFIEMLSNPKYTNYINGTLDNNNIFGLNEIPFEGYEHIQGLNTSHFWARNSDRIIQTINTLKNNLKSKEEKTYEEEQKLIKLNMALKAIDDYNFVNKNNPKYRIEKFIEMLSDSKYTNYANRIPDSNNIFSDSNEIPFEGYEHINGLNTKQFWHVNSDKIIETIYMQKNELENKENRTQNEEQKLIKLNMALKAIDDYNFVNKNNPKYRIEKFIEMLSDSKYTNYTNNIPDDNNIFSAKNKIPFEGYEHIDGLNTSQFWNRYSVKNIIPLLFYSSNYNDLKYDFARNAVMGYLNYNRRRKKQPEFKIIDEYIDTLDKTKKEVKSLLELRASLLLRKQQLSIENHELTEELNSSYRRAM